MLPLQWKGPWAGRLSQALTAHFSLGLLLGENEHVILSPLPCENQLLS